MKQRLQRLCVAGGLVLLTAFWMPQAARADEVEPAHLDVPYEPTHAEVVELMLRLAQVASTDYVVDLGCGDGRIVIAAAQKYGARGLGIDLDPQRIRESTDSAAYAGVDRLVQFRRANILDVPIQDANVVTLYLLNQVNLLIRPKLLRELRPGTRVVSHAFHMEDWDADATAHHTRARNKSVYLWIIPARVGGIWEWTTATPDGEVPTTLRLDQDFQALNSQLTFSGPDSAQGVQASVRGTEVTINAKANREGKAFTVCYRGMVRNDQIQGTQEWTNDSGTERRPWTALRQPVNVRGTWKLSVPSCPDFDGLLHVTGERDTLVAAYERGRNNPRQGDLPLYLWGSSIRFSLTATGRTVVFRGTLDGEAGAGLVYLDGWGQEPEWSAQRVAREAPAWVQPSRVSHAPVPEEPPARPTTDKDTTLRPGETGAVAEAAPTSKTEGQAAPLGPRRRWTPDMGAPQPRDIYENPDDGSVLAWIPAGTFTMGNDAGHEDEKPAHQVVLRGFWLGVFEVTNGQYAKFLKTQEVPLPYYWNDSRYNQRQQPVVGITWREAQRYCRWAGLRLPTEAEWEYAACGGLHGEYPTATGAISHALANIQGVEGRDQWESTSPVGSFPPNPLGLYDLAGNAWEWTSSTFTPYPYEANDGREDPEKSVLRVLRGGAWSFPADYSRTQHRHRFASHLRCDYAGFRAAMTTPRTEAPRREDQ